MKLQDLFEAVDTTSASSDTIKSMKSSIDHVAKLLFGVTAGPVKDLKRSKEAKFYGVSHYKSVLHDSKSKAIYLTFDNSTDSGEFEINSLVPMLIDKGSPEDRKITALYKKYSVRSKKKTNYIAHGDRIVLREVHLGHEITSDTVKLVRALLKILTGTDEVEEKNPNEPVEEPPKEDKKEPVEVPPKKGKKSEK